MGLGESVRHYNLDRFSLLSELDRLPSGVKESITANIPIEQISSIQGYILNLLTSDNGVYQTLLEEASQAGYTTLKTQADIYKGGNCRIISKRLVEKIAQERPDLSPQLLSYTPPAQQAKGYKHYYVSIMLNGIEIRIDPTWQQFDPNADESALPAAFWWGIQTQTAKGGENPNPEFFNYISAYREFWVNATPV